MIPQCLNLHLGSELCLPLEKIWLTRQSLGKVQKSMPKCALENMVFPRSRVLGGALGNWNGRCPLGQTGGRGGLWRQTLPGDRLFGINWSHGLLWSCVKWAKKVAEQSGQAWVGRVESWSFLSLAFLNLYEIAINICRWKTEVFLIWVLCREMFCGKRGGLTDVSTTE